MNKDIRDDEIPLTVSLPAISETKAKFESMLRAAMDREIADKKKERKVKGVEVRKKSKQKQKIVHSSSLDGCVAAEKDSQTYGSTSQLLSDADFSDSKGENSVRNEKKTNKQPQIQKNGHIDLIETPKKHEERNHNFKTYRQTAVRKNNIDCCTNNVKQDPGNMEESLEGENSSDSVDSKYVFKKPVPLPRIKTKTPVKVLSRDRVENYRSEDEFSSETPKTLIVEALVSADSATPSFDVRNGLPRKGEVSRSGMVQCSEELQMAEMDSPRKRLSATRHDRNKKNERMEAKHKFNSEEEEIVVDSAENIGSPLKRKIDQPEYAVEGREPVPQGNYSYEKIIGVIVHHCDCLQPDPLVQHPLVKVHLLCADTGQYLKKSSTGRSVSFFYENKTVDYILPQMTEPHDFHHRRSRLPSWEELIVFNEDIEYILNPNLSVVIMFEILDFVSFSMASARYKKLGSEGGWYRVAWAFLKPVGKNDTRNTERKVRLQLYKPHTSRSFSCDSCEPYIWWSTGQWDRYPGSLYVTVKGIHPPDNLQPALRSRSALQSEHSSCHINIEPEAEHELESSAATSLPAGEAVLHSTGLNWSKLPSQLCKVPNERAFSFATSSRGCFAVKFSSSGLFLACAFVSQDDYTIVVLTIPEGREFVKLAGHQGLVYDLHWSHNSALLLSASADCTVCIWDICNKKLQPIHMLPHPSFVYCAQFHPTNSSIVISGCCDSVVRVWLKSKKTKQYELSQELERHAGFVNTVCFDKHCRLFTGDSEGKICMWYTIRRRQSHHSSDWGLERELCVRELRNVVINKLCAHPGGQRLLVHARDSLLRMLDIATGSVIQWFKGALNHRVQTSACITPCGSLVWAASEDGTVCVWNADTGEQVATYTALGFHSASTGVDYHPQENMVAFCSYGNASHVVVCSYNKSSSGQELGVQVRQEGPCSDLPRDTSVVLQPTSLPPLVQSSLSRRNADEGSSDQLYDCYSASLSGAVAVKENSNKFILDADSLYREKRLANILEKIDQVLSLPSVRCVTSGSSSSVGE